MQKQARFYYPVQNADTCEIWVMCAFEGAGRSGVDFYYDRGEPVVFDQDAQEGAEILCHHLNERERVFPTHLPSMALQFLEGAAL